MTILIIFSLSLFIRFSTMWLIYAILIPLFSDISAMFTGMVAIAIRPNEVEPSNLATIIAPIALIAVDAIWPMIKIALPFAVS